MSKAPESFVRAYITAALWSTNDNSDESGGKSLDENYGPADIAPTTLERMTADCDAFYQAHGALITDENCKYKGCPVDEYAAHDFWLTREGHGAGFWDGGWIEPAATVLAEASRKFGSFDLYVGDDGLIYS